MPLSLKVGYSPLYRVGETNSCPSCGRSHWHIGRVTAECAFCGTAIPMDGAHVSSSPVVITHKRMDDAARGRFTINSRAA